VVDVAGWVAELDAIDELIGRRFVREEPRARAGVYVRGLLAGLERKNGWTLAEHAGAVSPDGMQRLLRTADWDIEGVRDDVRDYALDHLDDPVTGVFVLDDTGSSRRAAARRGCNASTPAPPGRSTTVSSGCSWPTPRTRAGR
jgi:SRSO17 transposase